MRDLGSLPAFFGHGQDSAPSLQAPAQLTQPVHHVWYAHFLFHWVTHTAPLPHVLARRRRRAPATSSSTSTESQAASISTGRDSYVGRLIGLAGGGRGGGGAHWCPASFFCAGQEGC